MEKDDDDDDRWEETCRVVSSHIRFVTRFGSFGGLTAVTRVYYTYYVSASCHREFYLARSTETRTSGTGGKPLCRFERKKIIKHMFYAF